MEIHKMFPPRKKKKKNPVQTVRWTPANVRPDYLLGPPRPRPLPLPRPRPLPRPLPATEKTQTSDSHQHMSNINMIVI